MLTKEEVTKNFKADLQALVDKYGATIEAKDHFLGYSECGEDIRITIEVPSIYDSNNELVRDWVEIDLGSYFWPTKKAELERTGK